ncbi:MAG: TlpA family protein disulfide reductase [Phycisphaeraceae bacterium]
MIRLLCVLRRGPHPWAFLPAFAVSAILLGGCDGSQPEAERQPEGERQAEAEQQTADESATAETLPVVGLEEIRAIIDEADRNDRVLVIDFWATWCVPCVAMFPDLHAGLKERGDAVRPVSVTLDGPDAEAKAVDFLQKQNAMADAYRVQPDGEVQSDIVDALGDNWNDVVIPAILVFDQNGELAGEFLEGGDATVRAILTRVDELTAAGAGAGDEG